MTYKELIDKCDSVTNDVYAYDYIIDYNGIKINYAAAHALCILDVDNKIDTKELMDNLSLANS